MKFQSSFVCNKSNLGAFLAVDDPRAFWLAILVPSEEGAPG